MEKGPLLPSNVSGEAVQGDDGHMGGCRIRREGGGLVSVMLIAVLFLLFEISTGICCGPVMISDPDGVDIDVGVTVK